jgi:Flp pilus assembly protein TadD
MRERSTGIQEEETPAVEQAKTSSIGVEASELPVILQRGISQIRNKDIHGGIATLHEYVDTAPGDSTAWLWLGWASALDNEFRTAERCFLHARRLGNPQAGEALEWLNSLRK